jgi:hypothetical protein
MRRREFLFLLGGLAARLGAFLQGLQQSGWSIGRNVRIDTRWATTPAEIRRHAGELAALAPDVILASGYLAVVSLQQAGCRACSEC